MGYVACFWTDPPLPGPLLEFAESLSPRVEAGDAMVYMDLGNEPAQRWSETLRASAVFQKLRPRVGVACNKLLGRLAARYGQPPITVIDEGCESAFLLGLPLEALNPPLELSETLARWGIRTLGALAALPSKKIISHLGKEGWRLHEAARGIDTAPFVPTLRTPVFLEKTDLDWPVLELDAFLEHAQPLLERLTTQLRINDLACQSLEIALHVEARTEERRVVRLRTPTCDLKTLRRLLQQQLTSQPPGGPVTSLCLIAEPNAPQKAQLSLFGPPALSPMQLATALAQLVTLVGAKRIGSPQTMDAYRPERFALAEFDPPPAPLFPTVIKDQPALTAIRVLRPAVSLHVIAQEAWPSRVRALAEPRNLQGTVRTASGPWRIEEHWWSEAPVRRDYWDIELTQGGLYRIYQDLATGKWFADGMYD